MKECFYPVLWSLCETRISVDTFVFSIVMASVIIVLVFNEKPGLTSYIRLQGIYLC
jgi:hypothetical protein